MSTLHQAMVGWTCDVLQNPPPLEAKQNQDEHAEEKQAHEMERLTSKRLDNYWHVNSEWDCDKPLPFGTLDFVLHKDSAVPSKFVVLDSAEEINHVGEICSKVWKLEEPSVLLSITGGAADLSLSADLEEMFKEGLIKAARSARAWIITGGTDTGVMKLTGEAMSVISPAERPPCIGIVPFRSVTHNEDILNKLAQSLSPADEKQLLKEPESKSRFFLRQATPIRAASPGTSAPPAAWQQLGVVAALLADVGALGLQARLCPAPSHCLLFTHAEGEGRRAESLEKQPQEDWHESGFHGLAHYDWSHNARQTSQWRGCVAGHRARRG